VAAEINKPPYPGLRPFTVEETALFFGRDGCVEELLARLAGTRFLAVLGSSGTGKSSLVQTGLISSLHMGLLPGAHARWCIVDFRPQGAPLRNLARRLLETERANRTGGEVSVDEIAIEILRLRLKREPGAILNWCREGHLPAGVNLLLLVDQFEELFRYDSYLAGDEAEAFVNRLLEVKHFADFAKESTDRVRIYITITMRSEYLGACALIDGLAKVINDGTFLTPRMTREECRQAIEGPAKVCGVEIEDRLVSRILNDLADFAAWDGSTSEANVPFTQGRLNRLARRADQLPLMQHALNRMWQSAKAVHPPKLKLADYERLGGLRGALDKHGDEILKELESLIGTNVARTIAAKIFRGLTMGETPAEAIRFPTRFDSLTRLCQDQAGVKAVIEAFRADGCNFLTPASSVPLQSDTYIDISHESLIRQWSRLSGWLEEEARAARIWRRLADAAVSYDHGEGGLLESRSLETFIAWQKSTNPNPEWAARYGGDFTSTTSFLNQSILAYRRRNATRIGAGIGATALVLVVTVLGIFAFFQRKQAQFTQDQLLQAQSFRLALLADEQLRAEDQATALLLALAALPDASIQPPKPYVARAELQLHAAIRRLRERLVLGSEDGTAALSVVFSKDGKELAATYQDGKVRTWDADNGMAKRNLQRTSEVAARAAAFSPDGLLLAVASDDFNIYLYNTENGAELRKFSGHAGIVTDVAFNAAGSQILTASADATVCLWDIKAGQRRCTAADAGMRTIWSAAYSRDERHIIAGSADGHARIFDADTLQESGEPLLHETEVTSVAYSPDGRTILTTSAEEALVWDADTRKVRFRVGKGVRRASFSNDGQYFVTASIGNIAQVWMTENGKQSGVSFRANPAASATALGDEYWLSDAKFTADDSRIATASDDGSVRIWDLKEIARSNVPLRGHEGPIRSAVFSADGRYVVTASEDKTARVWDAATHNTILVLNHKSQVLGAALSRTGELLVTAAADRTLRLWNAKTGSQIRMIEPVSTSNRMPLNSVALRADGRRVVGVFDGGYATIWDPESGEKIVDLIGHADSVRSATFSPDGALVLTASFDKTARLWNSNTGELLATFSGSPGALRSASFSPDGAHIVTASSDATAQVWETKTQRPTMLIVGHRSGVRSAVFSPDGRRIVTASDDQTVRFWDAETGEPTDEPLVIDGGSVWSASFSFDGNRIVTATDDGTPRIWSIAPNVQALVNHARKVAPRCLTSAQAQIFSIKPNEQSWCSNMKKWPYSAGARDR